MRERRERLQAAQQAERAAAGVEANPTATDEHNLRELRQIGRAVSTMKTIIVIWFWANVVLVVLILMATNRSGPVDGEGRVLRLAPMGDESGVDQAR